MKKLITICAGMLLVWSATAAPTPYFSDSSLPSQWGEYNVSYSSTNNVNVPEMLTLVTNATIAGLPSGPTWDFSQLRQTNETVLRTDIIDPSTGMDGYDFPDATYAEQDSQFCMGVTNFLDWRYYSFDSDGRVNYGSFTPGTDLDGLQQYSPPIVDIPATVTNGQSWSLNTSWNSTLDGYYPLYYTFSATDTADAFGTLILPDLGAVPAWRVHEEDVFNGYLYGLYLVETVTNEYYYWLVPGVGMAVQITLAGNNAANPGTLTVTNSVQRMFYASYYTNTSIGITGTIQGNLHIQLQSGSIGLNWDRFTNNPSSYVVQDNCSLVNTNWQSLGLTSNTNWTDSLSTTQRFYRVIGLP